MTGAHRAISNVLSIAGSDPSGGAGLQADLKTFAALGCHGMAVAAALTAQNTQRIGAIHCPPADFVAKQIDMVFEDIEVAVVKIGMLGTGEIATAVGSSLAAHRRTRGRPLPIIVDPVLAASSGASLGDETLVEAMWQHLFPLATLVTPNLREAARLAGTDVLSVRETVEAAARRLFAAIPTAWMITGGDGADATADDLLFDGAAHWLSSPRIATSNTHGTGCTLSSAIAAYLAKGEDLSEAVAKAKAYVHAGLAGADTLAVGRGGGPLDHFARWR